MAVESGGPLDHVGNSSMLLRYIHVICQHSSTVAFGASSIITVRKNCKCIAKLTTYTCMYSDFLMSAVTLTDAGLSALALRENKGIVGMCLVINTAVVVAPVLSMLGLGVSVANGEVVANPARTRIHGR